MIKVICNNDLSKVRIEGHALFDDYGKDIVCASVSSIVTTSVNAILSFDRDAIFYEVSDGYIQIEVKKDSNETKVLLTNMMNLLKELEKDYKKNIKIC